MLRKFHIDSNSLCLLRLTLLIQFTDLLINRNALYRQSQKAIPTDLPEGFIESPMSVGRETRLPVKKLPSCNDCQALIKTHYNDICDSITVWKIKIYEEPITFERINAQFVSLKGSIHSLY